MPLGTRNPVGLPPAEESDRKSGYSEGSSDTASLDSDRATHYSASESITSYTPETSAAENDVPRGWQASLFNPMQRLNGLLRYAARSDLTIKFLDSEKSYKVHRLVLAMSSAVLEEKVYSKPSSELVLDVASPAAFKWLLANMYMGCKNLPSVELASHVYSLAFMYEMTAVMGHCKQYLLHKVSTDNCHFAYQGAMTCGDMELASRCAQIASGAWAQGRSAVMRALPRQALYHLLEQDRLCLSSECSLFQAVVDWGQHALKSQGEGTDVRSQVEEFLPLIRFLAMTPEEFLDKVSPSQVLTADECVSILMNIRGRNAPLPTTFYCSLMGPRQTVFDDGLLQVLTNCPHNSKKSKNSDLGNKSYRQGLGFKLYFSSSIYMKSVQISSGFLPRDGQLLLLDSEGKAIMEAVDGEFMGHQCTCGKVPTPHSNLLSWTFNPPFSIQGKKEYIGKVRHSKSDIQIETIKEIMPGVTICGQITASPFKIEFYLR
ncbi:BTB/POZ domain-containing protein 2 [Hyalella azteca]|uniref:BTB/POZ domain-containing protein 2 n=1 Tax=Hyalella azteca TaxID=294128 RepID=A0A8B7NV58_HYAAZ|nr:BTB/POZ domain-containing protein 2 [Hyalella azteca]